MTFFTVIIWIALSYSIASNQGRKRNIGFATSLILSLLFSPIIGLIFTLLSKEIEPHDEFLKKHNIERAERLKQRKQKSIASFQQLVAKEVASKDLQIQDTTTELLQFLQSKKWYIIDNSAKHKGLLFTESGNLLFEIESELEKCKWEVMEGQNAIMFDRSDKVILYQVIYTGNNHLIMQSTKGTAKSYLVLSSEREATFTQIMHEIR